MRVLGCLILVVSKEQDFLYFFMPYFIEELIIINNKFFVELDEEIIFSFFKKLQITSFFTFWNTISSKIGFIFPSITD